MPITDDPIIDIVVTTYNSSLFIETCLGSIIKQNYDNWKLIIVDDGSKDNTINIIRSFIKRHKIAKKCSLYAIKENRGYGMSLKTGIENGEGEIITIVDSDDALSHQGALSIIVNYYKRYPEHALLYSNYYECDVYLKSKSLIRCRDPKPGEAYLGRFNSSHYMGSELKISHLKAFKRKFYNMTEGLDGTLQKAVDKDLILKLEEVGPIKHIPQGLYLHRKNENSISWRFRLLPDIKRNQIMEAKHQMYVKAKKRRTDKANAEKHKDPVR